LLLNKGEAVVFQMPILLKALSRCTPLYGNPLTVYLLYMLFRQTIIASIFFVFLPLFSIGQAQKPEQQLKNYLLQLEMSKVDTILIIKSGCTGCAVKYTDTAKAVTDGKTIYVLSQAMGQFRIVSFDDFGRQNHYLFDTCSLFDTIKHYKAVFQQKNVFYKKIREGLSKGRFQPPRPIHYSYNDLIIKIPNFSYEYSVIENDTGNFIFPERKEKWFVVTKKVIDNFFSLLKMVRS